MSELVIAHISEATQPEELRVFLRTTYRSGVFARADVVFLFSPNALSTSMVNVIYEEHYSFRKILFMASENLYDHNSDNSSGAATFMFPSAGSMISSFNLAAYRRNDSENVSSSQPFWGSYSTDYFQFSKTQLAEAFRWGSVVGFDTSDLNAEDALQGFFDHPPVMLRRWPCYQMLLGMVRRRFKHVLLVDVGSVVFLGDPFSITAKRKFGLYLSLEDRAWGATNASELGVNRSTSSADPTESRTEMRSRHSRVAVSSASKTSPKRATNPQLSAQQKALGKRRPRKGAVPGGLYERVYGKHSWSALEDFERRKRLVNSGVILGSIHQVRGLANAMATEIVRVALERANRDAFPDSVLLSYLLHKSPSVLGRRVLDHLHLLDNGDSFVHSLIGSQQHSSFRKQAGAAYAVIHGSSKNKRWRSVVQAIRTDICTCNSDARAYTDCHDISKLL
ncbi:hypothetical protein KP509_26G048200 [Ceratopteris richardii]|nr:hypothetical protein KP509_26G048200 [Ceratopteris richardii]